MTKVISTEESADGLVAVKLLKDDGGIHRVIIVPGQPLGEQLDSVDGHLVAMGQSPIKFRGGVAARVAGAQTTHKVAAWRAKIKERIEQHVQGQVAAAGKQDKADKHG